MFADFTKSWEEHYNAAGKDFFLDVQKLAKKSADDGRNLSTLLDPPRKNTVALVAALARLNKIPDPGSLKDDQKKAGIAALSKEVKGLSAEVKKYVPVLDKASAGEMILRGTSNKAKIKDLAPNSYRQLKVLKTELLAIEARIVNTAKNFETAKQSQKIADKQQVGMKKARDNNDEDKAKSIEADARLKKMLLTLATGYKSGMAKGAAIIQKLKQAPTLANYNALMNDGGRDISQNIVNIGKMKANAAVKSDKLVKSLPDPGPMVAEIARFGNGDLRRLKDTASQAEVNNAIAQFIDLHKRITAAYQKLAAVK
jgi:hypothetical protein